MGTRHTILAGTLLFLVCASVANGQAGKNPTPLPPAYMPSGEQTFKQFCASCHGADAKGNGPASYSLKVPAPDLTTLAKRHEGKFPYKYVESVLLFGVGFTAHGSSDMPTWGPVFLLLDKHDERTVRQRIRNVCDYLASLQEKAVLAGEGN